MNLPLGLGKKKTLSHQISTRVDKSKVMTLARTSFVTWCNIKHYEEEVYLTPLQRSQQSLHHHHIFSYFTKPSTLRQNWGKSHLQLNSPSLRHLFSSLSFFKNTSLCNNEPQSSIHSRSDRGRSDANINCKVGFSFVLILGSYIRYMHESSTKTKNTGQEMTSYIATTTLSTNSKKENSSS